MDISEEQLARWIDGLRTGNDAAMLDFWNLMGPALERLAERRMEPGLQRRVGPEDVAQSVCRTFFRRMQHGEFQFGEESGIWRLLCAITLAKVREKARHHLRLRRGLQRETTLEGPEPGAEFIHASSEPTPAEHSEFADLLQHVLSELDDEERQIVELRLQDQTQVEIATALGCAERTVRRILKRVESKFEKALAME